MSFSATGYSQPYTGTTICSSGSVLVNGSCSSAALDSSPYAGAPVLGYDLKKAYDNLPIAAKKALLSPELLAEIAARLWRDAALSPGYQGIPFDTSKPPKAVDFPTYQSPSPNPSLPRAITSDLDSPIVSGPNPISPSVPNPNQIQTDNTNSVKVDLGVDPGTPTPPLDDAPTDLFKPISDAVAPLLSWRVPAHSSACPTWQASPTISGHVFAIDVSYHCTISDQYRALIQAIAAACFAIMAVFIILDA